ncbi:hypothetical protein Tco_0779527 [Tanacetum coccineum]
MIQAVDLREDASWMLRSSMPFSDIHLQLQDAVVGGGVPTTGKHQLRNRRGHHNGTTNTDSGAMAQAIAPKIAATSVKVLWHQNCYGTTFRLCWNEHSTVRLTSRERDLKSVHMEYRHFRNDHYASQFQQSGSVETEGQSSSMAHKQSVTTHHLNNDPDAEQQGFLRATVLCTYSVNTSQKFNTDPTFVIGPFCVPIQLDDDDDGNIEDNEQLANAIQESLKPYSKYQERDLKSVYMESRHFRNDLYASQFQQSGSVATEGTRTNCFYARQSSSMAHKQFVTTHHLNTDPDAEQYQSFAHTLSTPTIQNIDVDRIAKPQNHPFNFATQRHKRSSSTYQITSSTNRKHRSVSRHISLTSQRLDGGANKNVKRRTTFNCCGISNPQTINNELLESSFALLRNTRSIHEELPESSYAHSPGTLSLHFNQNTYPSHFV